MATTSLWAIKGRIDHLIDYVEDPKKTKTATADNEGLQALWDVISYTTRDNKTEQKLYVSGINCLPQIAVEQMIITKKQFAKDDGRIAYHGFQSFKPKELTPDIAHEIGLKLAQEMWGDKFQVVVSTHLDKEHLHNHFALNSVSFLDGMKYDRSKAEYVRLRKISDRLCKEYSLSVIENPNNTRTPRTIYFAEKEGKPTRYNLMRSNIDEAIKQSTTSRHFTAAIQSMGYELKFEGKYWTIKAQGATHPTRLKTLGDEYTEESIKDRILANYHRKAPFPLPEHQTKRYKLTGNIKDLKTVGGLQGLYLHYRYKLGMLPNSNKSKFIHPYLREDIRYMEQLSRHSTFLNLNKI